MSAMIKDDAAMDMCDTCGNVYDKCFTVMMAGQSHRFDCFECAIHKLAPQCRNCGCLIIGHGIEAEGTMFCCAHCASAQGVLGAEDRVRSVSSPARD